MYSLNSNVTMYVAYVLNNTAPRGGSYSHTTGLLFMDGTVFKNNTGGGGVFSYHSFDFINLKFIGNSVIVCWLYYS
jgi:hypothetical protein